MQNSENNTWLCRNCNTLVSNDLTACPKCNALHPEETELEPTTPQEIATEIKMDDYANNLPSDKDRYNFKESVLTTVADISLVLGLFITVATLIAPHIIEFTLPKYTVTLISICAAVVLVAITMTTWALLRCVADISRRTREMHEANHK